MTICAGIRTLIVAGLVLFLVKSGWNFPVPLHRKVFSSEKQLIMTRKPCQDSIGNVGVCTFKYDCIRQKGLTLSTCVDGFLFGACCSLNKSSSIKVASIPFSKENEFIFQKQSNIISEADEFVANADSFYLSNYSKPEYEIFNSTFPSTSPELDVNISTYTSSNGVLNSFTQETTDILLTENSTTFTSFSNSSINVTDADNKTESYLKNENHPSSYNLLVNNTITPIDLVSSISKEITDNTEVTDDELSYISHNITASSYGTDVFNTTEAPMDVKYNWEQNESLVTDDKIISTDNWWQISKLSVEDAFVKESQNVPVIHKPENFNINNLDTDNTSQLIDNSSVSTAIYFGNQTTPVLEIPTNTDKTFLGDERNASNEFLTTNFTNYSEQKAEVTNTYEISNNQRSSISTYIDYVSEIPSLISDHTTPLRTTTSRDNEKVTSKQMSTNMEIPAEKSFTIYGVPSTLYAIEKDKESPISSTTKGYSLSNVSLSTMDRDSRITTQGFPLASQWPAQPQLPASFQSLVAQLTSGEMPSPVTLKLNLNYQTVPSIDKTTLNKSNLPTDQMLGLAGHDGVDSSENFYDDSNHFEEQHVSNGNVPSLTMPTASLEQSTPFASEDLIKVTINGDSYNKTTPYTNSYATNFSSDKEFMPGIYGESTVHSNEKHENSNKTKITPPTIDFKTPVAFEKTDFETFSSPSFHTKNPLQAHDGYANVSKTDSFDLNVNDSYNLATSTIETFKDNNTLSNPVQFDNDWFETVLYGKISKVPEIVNNHASKSTTAMDSMNTNDEIGVSFVNITKLPVDFTTLGTVNNIFESHSSLANKMGFPVNTQTLPLFTVSKNSAEEIDSVSSSNESIENTYPLITDAYVIESNTSQNRPGITTTAYVNQYTVNETSTIATIHTTSLFEPSHELEANMNLEEMKFNGTHVANGTLENEIPNSFHEHLPAMISTSQISYTVFKDDLYYNNITGSFNENNVSNQSQELNFAEKNNSVSELDSNLNYDKENNSYSANFSSSIDSVSTELTIQSVLNNTSIFLTTEMSFINIISKNEESSSLINIENTNINSTTPVPLVKNPNTTPFGEIRENSTLSTDHAISTTNNSVPSVENSTLFTSDAAKEEFTQKYNTTITSHNSNTWGKTTTHASMKASSRVPDPPTMNLTESTVQKIKWNYKKDCGVRLMQPIGRIVGGKNTYFGKWPWQALVKEATWLGLFVKNKCGGVLITAKYVLTAAHCQPGFFASLLVVLGTHDLSETFDNKASVIRNVKRMVVHRHYNAQTFENDLALLEMETTVEFSPYVVPICLPFRKEDFTGKMAFVTGWGKLTHVAQFQYISCPLCKTYGGDVPNILQEVQVPIVANGDCQRMFFHAGHQKAIRSNFVCAGYTNGGQDSCEGDSGGPLMVQREDNRWVLVGTVSHGIGCADPNLPGVYMRMSSYRPWIDSIINKHR